jgi:uncharacterized protein with ParB-like and HNH nuclease domain
MTENLCSISINDLISGIDNKKICFIVPSYQRGYRWEPDQVNKLLDDLYEFDELQRNNNQFVGNFYCLQPIVVKKLSCDEISTKMGQSYQINVDEDYYEIIDGQQRMTTMYILLKFILRDSDPFDLEYERDQFINFGRRTLLQQLPNILESTNKSDSTYADEYYILQAADTIKNWFDLKKTETKKNNIKSQLEDCVCEKTKVIWYEIDKNANCYSVFKNINNGKIPLTDAELVKAMLLNSKHFTNNVTIDTLVKQEQNRYSRLWDEIQKSLENKDLWSFITGGANAELSTHIDLLIELIVKINDSSYVGHGDHKFFSYFEEKLNKATNKKDYIEWVFEELRKCFRTLQDWDNDYENHNYIGYLLTYSGKDLSSRIEYIIKLQEKYNNLSKNEFHNHLVSTIRSSFKNLSIDTINYEDNGKQVEKLLMLFNIEELNDIHQKFNFYINKDGWSIEHIKAQHSEIVEEKKIIQDDYMNKEKSSMLKKRNMTTDQTLISLIDQLISRIDNFVNNPNATKSDFELLAENINQSIDGFDNVTMHMLGNLALLSKSDNSAFGNSPFYEKRNTLNIWLRDLSKNIPHSTEKAFHKMYSTQQYSLDFTRWSKQDFDDMFIIQKQKLVINDNGGVLKGFIGEGTI